MDTTVKMQAVPSQNAIVMRGTPDQLLLAQKIIDDLDKAKPEVVVDIAVLEVNKDLLRNIGLQLPGSIGVQLQSSTASTTTGTTGTTSTTSTTTSTTSTSSGLTLNDLGNINATNFGISIGAATLNMLLTDSDTRVLQNPQIRAVDGEKANSQDRSRKCQLLPVHSRRVPALQRRVSAPWSVPSFPILRLACRLRCSPRSTMTTMFR